MLPVHMERHRHRRDLIHHAVNIIGEKRHHIAGAKHLLPTGFNLGVPGVRAVVEAVPEDVLLRSIYASHHRPGPMVVGRSSAAREPGEDKDGEGVVRLLMENMYAESLLL